jgi:hypothetical protein
MSNSNPFLGYSSGFPPPPPSTIYTASSSSVYQQIEGSANYYQPNVYELLTFYGSLTTQSDELDGQFIPLTDVQPTTAQRTLIFAVGILPPSSQVMQALLDRSATIAQTTQLNLAATTPGVNNVGPASNMGGPPTHYQFSPAQISGLVSQQYAAMNGGQAPNPSVAWMLTAQSLRETSGNWPDFNPGFIMATNSSQPTFSVKGGGVNASNGASSTWRSFPTPQAGTQTFINTALRTPAEQQAAASGDVAGYVAALGAAGYYGPYTDAMGVFHDAAMAQQEYLNNFQNLYNAAMAAAPNPSAVNLSNIPGSGARPVSGDANSTPAWQGKGSPNANSALTAISTYANSQLNTSNLGQQFQAAQQYMINATVQAIQRMQNTPPLKMLVNPQSFKLSAEKIIADGDWSRNGPIVEQWGEQLDKIEASGKVAAFFAMDAQASQSFIPGVGAGPGITRIARQYSQAYQNFLSLWLLYKNNGGIWLADFINSSSTQSSNLSVLGSIYIYYDNILYIGSFDSFNLSETETAPYTLEYNFSFTVRATFLLDNTDDLSLQLASLAESQNYGVTQQAPPILTSNTIPNQQPAGIVQPGAVLARTG